MVVAGIGLTAPPIGLNVFVAGAIAREGPMGQIDCRVVPFPAADRVRRWLLVVLPGPCLGLVRRFSRPAR